MKFDYYLFQYSTVHLYHRDSLYSESDGSAEGAVNYCRSHNNDLENTLGPWCYGPDNEYEYCAVPWCMVTSKTYSVVPL